MNVSVKSPYVTVTVVVPALTAVTKPLASTVATVASATVLLRRNGL